MVQDKNTNDIIVNNYYLDFVLIWDELIGILIYLDVSQLYSGIQKDQMN